MSKKRCEEKDVDLLLTGEEGKRYYVLIKGFNTFIYYYTPNCGKKHVIVWKLSVQKKILKFYIKNCFEINDKQIIKIPKKGEYAKNYERRIKSPFMIYADFESILVPEDNGKKSPEEIRPNIKNMLLRWRCCLQFY